MKTPTPENSARAAEPSVSNRGKWMALIAALLGWMFDGFEIGMFPLVGRPALTQLLDGQPIDRRAASFERRERIGLGVEHADIAGIA